ALRPRDWRHAQELRSRGLRLPRVEAGRRWLKRVLCDLRPSVLRSPDLSAARDETHALGGSMSAKPDDLEHHVPDSPAEIGRTRFQVAHNHKRNKSLVIQVFDWGRSNALAIPQHRHLVRNT